MCPSCRPARATIVYDVLHTNSNEQWNSLTEGLVMDKITAKEVPNVADVYPYAVSDKIVGVSISPARSARFRTTRASPSPPRGRISPNPKLAGVRGSSSSRSTASASAIS